MARVLIIEDEPAIALVLQELLTDEGHEVTTALDGLAGLERLRHEPTPGIVLVDLFMPGMSGRDVVQSMRADEQLNAVPVVIITGAVPDPRDFPPEGSYQALLPKPFDLEDVIEKVKNLSMESPAC